MIYKIAGIPTEMKPLYPLLKYRCDKYLSDDSEALINAVCTEDEIASLNSKHPEESYETCEYTLCAGKFYRALLDYDGIAVHSSAVVVGERAYLFSADSGVGKSTHTSLWLKNISGAYILNDDRPAVICRDGKYYACGTPFSGKSDLSVNKTVLLGGICFISRGRENSISEAPRFKAFPELMRQTQRCRDKLYTEKLIAYADRLLSENRIYEMKCRADDEAALLSYNFMRD